MEREYASVQPAPAPPGPPLASGALGLAIDHGRKIGTLLDHLEARLFGDGVRDDAATKPSNPDAIAWAAHLVAQLNGEAAQRLEAILKRL